MKDKKVYFKKAQMNKIKPKWLIEKYDNDTFISSLIEEVKNQNMDVEVVKYVPWQGGTYNYFNNDDCVVFYGTLNLARQL